MKSHSEEHFRVCAGVCGRMTRPSRMPKSQAPDTVARQAHGKCQSCLRAIGIYTRRSDNTQITPDAEETRFRHTVNALSAYMEKRRERLSKITWRVLT